MSGSGGVIAVVLAQTTAGALALTWCTPLWHEAKRSYFTLFMVLLTVLIAVWAWWAARGAAHAGDEWAVRSALLAGVTAFACGASAASFLARRRGAGRALGIAALPVAIVTLFAMAATGRQGFAVAAFQVVAGAAFLGASVNGLFLGHWYLTDRKLPRTPINRATDVLLVACLVEIAAVTTSGFSGTAASQAFNPLLTSGALAPWIALGMVGATLLIAALVRTSLRGERASAVQSATGFYYLAVVTAFTAEIAVKTRFFPG